MYRAQIEKDALEVDIAATLHAYQELLSQTQASGKQLEMEKTSFPPQSMSTGHEVLKKIQTFDTPQFLDHTLANEYVSELETKLKDSQKQSEKVS